MRTDSTTPIKKQKPAPKYGLTPRINSNASRSGNFPSFGKMLIECLDDHNSEVPDRRMWAVSGDTDDDNSSCLYEWVPFTRLGMKNGSTGVSFWLDCR